MPLAGTGTGSIEKVRDNNIMKIKPLLLALAFLASNGMADGLPDLGDAAQSELSPAMEQKVGASIMRDIRWQEPSFVNDAEVSAYLNHLGMRLAMAVPGSTQDFEFFALKDPTLNAFALPGGFIGVHTALILTTQSESELAGVLGHEISHVKQHHIARTIGKQSQSSLIMLASMLVAVLAARSNSQVAQAAIAGGSAAGMQTQLNYSRDFEREADRMGLATLEAAGFDVRGMAAFFERLQRETRIVENNAPAYLRTHPLTTERISDMENRVQGMPYRQVPDSLDYQLVRAKLRVSQGAPADAAVVFQTQLKEKKFSSEAAAHYGLARAELAMHQPPEAARELAVLRRLKVSSPMVETLAAEIRLAEGDQAGALAVYRDARSRYPGNKALLYGQAEALLDGKKAAEALALVDGELQNMPSDPTLISLQARASAALGLRLQQHRAQAELYALQGRLTDSILQLQLAQKAGDGSFYELSAVDARLKTLKVQEAEERKEKQNQ